MVARSLMRSMLRGSLEEDDEAEPMEEDGPHQAAAQEAAPSPKAQELAAAARATAK
jgi:hypothetical protein